MLNSIVPRINDAQSLVHRINPGMMVDVPCDVYITGDIDHHTGIDAVDQGLCIIDAGHYGIEHIFMKDIRDYLEKVLTGVRMECVPVKHPFTVV